LTSANLDLAFTDGDQDISFLGFCFWGCEKIAIGLDGASTGLEVDTGIVSFNVLAQLADGRRRLGL